MIIGNIVVTWLFFTGVFLLAKYVDKLSIIDSFWGPSFMVVAIYSWVVGSKTIVATLVTLLVLIWGIRLASHISIRNFGKKEDYRYQAMRDRWDHVWLTAYYKVFLLQGLLMLSIAFPIILINKVKVSPINGFVYLGLIIWIIGFIFESVGDYQLKIFLKNREDSKKIMTKGLWAYTRHPNYFGEVTMWWGIFIIVFSIRLDFYLIISPLVITFLILKVSGIPLLEEKYKDRPGWAEYSRKTNKFIPWFQKK